MKFMNKQQEKRNIITEKKNYRPYMITEILIKMALYHHATLTKFNVFLSLISVFEECRSIIPFDPYMKSCKQDVCSGKSACTSLQAYASVCAKSGVCVAWRNYTNGECGERLHYISAHLQIAH